MQMPHGMTANKKENIKLQQFIDFFYLFIRNKSLLVRRVQHRFRQVPVWLEEPFLYSLILYNALEADQSHPFNNNKKKPIMNI